MSTVSEQSPSDDAATQTLRDSRHSYEKAALSEDAAAADPFAQFALWYDEAAGSDDKREANAVTVCTVDAAGKPSARIVLLRGYDARGFVFFTNYESRKGREIAETGVAALLFFWEAEEREVRIEGSVARINADESDEYFARRPRGHRLSAWASPQSRVVGSRAELEAEMESVEKRFPGDVPRPPYWGGFRVVPEYFEFWQGRRNRVHDRVVYKRGSVGWNRSRLAP